MKSLRSLNNYIVVFLIKLMSKEFDRLLFLCFAIFLLQLKENREKLKRENANHPKQRRRGSLP